MTTFRRNGGIFKVVLTVVVFFVCVYLVYLYNDVSGQLKDTERTAERYRREQETVAAQLQVQYEHRARLEKALNQDQIAHIRAIDDLTVAQDDLKQKCNNENQQFNNRLSSLNQQYKMLKTQHEDMESDYGRLQNTCDKDKEDHKKRDELQNEEYNKFKQEKILEVSSLKDTVANREREKEQLTNDLLKFKQQLQDTVDKVNLDQQTIAALQQEITNQKHQLDLSQAAMQSVQMELYQAKNLNQQQASALKNQQLQLGQQQGQQLAAQGNQQFGAQQGNQQLGAQGNQQFGAQQGIHQLGAQQVQQLGAQHEAQQFGNQPVQQLAGQQGLAALLGAQQLGDEQLGAEQLRVQLANLNAAGAQQLHVQEGLGKGALQGLNHPLQQGAQLAGGQPKYGIEKQIEGIVSKRDVPGLFNVQNHQPVSHEVEKKDVQAAVEREQEQRQIAPPRRIDDAHIGSQKLDKAGEGVKQSHQKLELPNVPYIDDKEASDYKHGRAGNGDEDNRIEHQGPVNLQVQEPVFRAAAVQAVNEVPRGQEQLMFQAQHPDDLLQQLQPQAAVDDGVKHEQMPRPAPQDVNDAIESQDLQKQEDEDDEENYDDEYDNDDNDDNDDDDKY